MKLRDWPEFDLIRPAGANRLSVGFKIVRTIVSSKFNHVLDQRGLQQKNSFSRPVSTTPKRFFFSSSVAFKGSIAAFMIRQHQ